MLFQKTLPVALGLLALPLSAAPVHLVDEKPVEIRTVSPGVFQVDFGKVAFGNLRLEAPSGANGNVTVHFGEALKKGRIDRKPPGTVRYSKADIALDGKSTVIAAPPADERNTQKGDASTPPAVLTPAEWGVVTPFRWVEIEGWPGELTADQITRQAGFQVNWDDDAASFSCSDDTLNRIWDLCRYSIKATTFAGIYIDGDRERIPYEADTYLNQLSAYTTNTDVEMSRETFDWLMKHPTWPTEWAFHMIFMARADWRHTGDTAWLSKRYESLKPKLQPDRIGPDGLMKSNEAQQKRDDIIDWPKGERDGFVFTPVNTVVNAFYLQALADMAELARALGKEGEAADFEARAEKGRIAFQEKLFDTESGLYRDGVGTDHTSLHANVFPLAFGLVPPPDRERIGRWLAGRGMKCSVYVAQYLLEGLFENHLGAEALGLITADTSRSWRGMLESGATITWEAWDVKSKRNLDWNHAWGAAPANILPRFVLGARPLTPGWKSAKISPNPGDLKSAEGKVPTPRGAIMVGWKNGATFDLTLTLPAGMSAKLDLPAGDASGGVFVNGRQIPATRVGSRWHVDGDLTGSVVLQVK